MTAPKAIVFTNSTFLLVLTLIVASLVSAVAADSSDIKGEAHLEHAVEVPTSEVLLHHVRYNYAFPQLETIYVEDFGMIAASGTLAHLTDKRQITLLSSPDGKVLATIPIVNARKHMGNDQFEMPKESDFPESQRQGKWSSKESFVETATMELLIPPRFTNGCHPYVSGEQHVIRTAYSEVPFENKRITIQVALLLTCPKKSDLPFHFTARFCARQRHSHSNWRDRLEPEAEKAVEVFISNFMAAIGAAGSRDKNAEPTLPAVK